MAIYYIISIIIIIAMIIAGYAILIQITNEAVGNFKKKENRLFQYYNSDLKGANSPTLSELEFLLYQKINENRKLLRENKFLREQQLEITSLSKRIKKKPSIMRREPSSKKEALSVLRNESI